MPAIRSVGEQLQTDQTKWDLQQAFRASDSTGTGYCSRDDFINAVFDQVRVLKPADLMRLLMAFADEYPEHVNYGDFLRLTDR